MWSPLPLLGTAADKGHLAAKTFCMPWIATERYMPFGTFVSEATSSRWCQRYYSGLESRNPPTVAAVYPVETVCLSRISCTALPVPATVVPLCHHPKTALLVHPSSATSS